MADSGGGCSRLCMTTVLTAGFLALFLWLSYRPITPRYYITVFSLSLTPGNKTDFASFVLEIENKNKEMGVYHDDIALSLSFNSTLLANASIPAFYQGHQKTADKYASFSGDRRRPWAKAVSNGSAVFRVGVESAVRYKAIAWTTRRHAVSVAGDVPVDENGTKTGDKGIRLRSAAPRVQWGPVSGHILLLIVVTCTLMKMDG